MPPPFDNALEEGLQVQWGAEVFLFERCEMKCWKIEARLIRISFIAVCLVVILMFIGGASSSVFAQDENPTPPDEVVKLIFIHHSTGENWLRDCYGELGKTLGENNYFVSDTNYGWGPEGIGDRTDIPDWAEWFRGENTSEITRALYSETGQHSSYTRSISDPGGENEISVVAFNASNSIQSLWESTGFTSTRPAPTPRWFRQSCSRSGCPATAS